MSFNFTIVETERENLPNGDYTAIVRSVEEKMDKYGSYVEVQHEILDPVQYIGRTEYERFYIGSYETVKQGRAKWQFSVLCKQLTGLKTGEALTEGNLVGKKFILTIKNNEADNGKVYQNTENRRLLPNQDEEPAVTTVAPSPTMYGNIEITPQVLSNAWPINDDVPF